MDSDGTIFDSMNQKHKNCFIQPLVDTFSLEEIKDKIKKNWINVNLHSKKRGINRFEALILIFEELKKYKLFIEEFKVF